MPTCSFCKKIYRNPRGLTIFTFDGRSIFYCSSKCRRNAELGRDPKKTNWVKKTKKDKSVKNSAKTNEAVKNVEESNDKILEVAGNVKTERKQEKKTEKPAKEKKK